MPCRRPDRRVAVERPGSRPPQVLRTFRTVARVKKSSSRTVAKSRSASSGPVATWASRPWRCTPTATVAPCTCGWPTKPGRSGPILRARATCGSTPSSTRRASRAPTRCIRATGSSPRTRTLPPPVVMPASPSSDPSPEAIALMGSKTAARQAAMRAGVPVVPGTDEPLDEHVSDADVLRIAAGIGYPLMLKAVAGGGGKGHADGGHRQRTSQGRCARRGRRRARPSAIRPSTSSAASSSRGTSRCSSLAITHGTVLPFVERECSLQRRHQKVVEESRPRWRCRRRRGRSLTAAAAAVARAANYTNAGTIEFLLDEAGEFYFLEMNTRLQVEHPITEMVTGVDLVAWQIRIARGERLTLDPGCAARAARPRHRVPRLRRGSRQRLHALAGAHHRPARSAGPRRP